VGDRADPDHPRDGLLSRRGRVHAARFFLTIITSGAAVVAIALPHPRGGLDMLPAGLRRELFASAASVERGFLG